MQRVGRCFLVSLFCLGLWSRQAFVQRGAPGRPLHLSRLLRRACPSGGKALQVLVPVANGCDAITVTCLSDVLTRAGAEVTLASVEKSLEVRLAGGLSILAGASMRDCADRDDWVAVACPGGEEGAERLCDDRALVGLLKQQRRSGRVIAAVGEAPAIVLAENRLLEFDEKATGYPSPRFRKALSAGCAGWWDAEVVMDRKVITSKGPGTALQCALKIVEVLYGLEKAMQLASELITHRSRT
eukprot:TRINITY_DN42146_c0_g1_i1.p1 TRINITY_DN42146_c0_g1~~TRINITY_DN42146_c0_g1_i1.p1  ORF type:complete len:242 (-),score=45.57 TRINITY_DN42146_c0_g1_i1:2-727(-)